MKSLRWNAGLAVALLSIALLPKVSRADNPAFDQITAGDYEKIVKELSANFAYSSVTPASSLGGLWGFEFGLVAGITKTPEILALVKRNSASYKEDKFPHAGALLRVGAPLGLTGELMIFPKITVSDLSLSQYAGAAQWTLSDVLLEDFFLNLAIKGFFSKTNLSYTQQITSTTLSTRVDATVEFDDVLFGGQFLVSKKLLVFEPYVGLGFVKANGELSVRAAADPNATIFASGFGIPSSGGRSATAKPTSAQLLAGVDVRLLFIALGAEYQRSFGTTSVTGRLSFRF